MRNQVLPFGIAQFGADSREESSIGWKPYPLGHVGNRSSWMQPSNAENLAARAPARASATLPRRQAQR